MENYSYRYSTQAYRKRRKSERRFINHMWKKFRQYEDNNHKSTSRMAIRQITLESSDIEIEKLLVEADLVFPRHVYLD